MSSLIDEQAAEPSSSRGARHSVDMQDSGASDTVLEDQDEDALFAEDPFEPSDVVEHRAKRRTKTPPKSIISRFIPSSSDARGRASPVPPVQTAASSSRAAREVQSNTSTEAILSYLDTAGDLSQTQEDKDVNQLDWYVEGPGRRVGYDDLTAIDWIFEYAKERQRLRVLLSNTAGVLGHIQRLADASQIWLVLVLTGIACGLIAAGIDITSDWLADLKRGYCATSHGRSFYLNRQFCCLGYDEMDQCMEWKSWSFALGARAKFSAWTLSYVFFVLFSVMFAVAASVLVRAYAPYAKQSGIPEVKTVLGGFVIRKFLGAWTLVVKSIGLCLAVASGLWLGKEGPLVHVACCCANLVLKSVSVLNDNEARKREVLSAAAAAGISVAFGSPVGGVLFSLEQLSYYFPDKTMWQSFVCAMVAAFTLQFVNPFRSGKLVLFQVVYHSGWHAFELVPFVVLGIIGGIYGGLFIKFNMKIAEWRKDQQRWKSPLVEVVIVALLTAIVNFPIKFMRAQSSELVYNLFAECSDITDDQLGLCKSGIANTGVIFLLLASAVLGSFLAGITFGLEIPAGIILPSIAVGALYGRAVGLIVEVWQREHPLALVFASCEQDVACITPGTYAIIGAASALAGATRMTVSIVVIMFELTGVLTYVLPIMIAVMLSKWVGDAISPRGIYESWIHFNAYPFLDNKDNPAAIPDVAVSQVMTRIEDLIVLEGTGHTINTLNDLLATRPYRGFPVVSTANEALLLGYISRTELSFALASAQTARHLPGDTEAFFAYQSLADPNTTLDLRPWMDQTPITLNSRSGLQLAASMFLKLGLRYIVFADRGVLRGLLTKKDVWFLLNGTGADSPDAADVGVN